MPDSKNEGKGKGKGKKKGQESDSDEDSDDFTKRIKASTRRGKQKDALFRVKWWRVVLGWSLFRLRSSQALTVG